jgi:DNA phosphorothioation-dependent restriction protein DptH
MKMHNSEKSAVVSCLHPSVLEMIQARTLFLIHSILHLIKEQIRFKSKNGFNIGKWEIICDLASIDTPIVGLMSALSHDLITDGDGEGLLHKIGKPDPNSQILSAKAILQNHDFEDFDITSKELFKNSQDSKLIARIIKNYQRLHPHTNEGLTISFLQNRFLQHTIAAIDSFLDQRFLLLKKSKVSTSEAPFKLNLRIYSNAFDSSKFDNWLKNWEEEILSLQSRESDNRYKNVEISLAYKVYDIDHKGQSSLEKIMDLDGSADITFLDNFIREGFEKSDFEYLEDFDYRDFDIKFPILEKKLCNVIGIVHNTTQRRRIISNNQFYIQHKHIELLSALRNLNVNNSKDFPIVVNEGNYEPWIRVIDKFHLYSNWVVCIDPNIDEGLLKLTSNEKYPDRDIIGFGSGVGARGESNYTISCGQFQLKDVLQNLIVKTKSIFRDHWTNEFEIETFCNNVIKRSLMLSGLSLVKAVGFSEYARDLISYSMIHRFTEKAEEQICNILVSLDAYIHWFNNDDNAKRPDLLNIKVILKKNNTLKIKLGLIECKLAKYTDSHIIKAYQQIENGLRLLIPKFFPKPKNVADAKPDSKYWWLQLHRLISTKIRVNTIDKNKILVALANMEKGLFEIKWQAAILTFWCDKKESIVDYRQDNVNVANESVVLHVWQLGLNFIKDAFKDSTSFNIFAENQFFDNEPSFDDANNNDSANKIHNNFELPVKKKNIEKNDSSKEKNASNFQEAHEESSKLDLEETNKDDELISRSKKDKDFLCENYVINSDCRILLGQCPNSNRKIYWEFGHEDMQNRHLLIFGGSGSGKTYAIQALVLELSMQKIHSLIVDYTSSFTAKQLEKVFIEAVRPKQFYPLKKEQDKIPLNPFKLQTIDFGDGTVQDEEVSNVSNRVADILKKVFLLGDQQYSYIVQSVEEGLGSRPGNFDFQDLYESLAELDSSGKLSHKIAPFVNTKPFNFALANENWQYLFSNVDKYCNIFQLIGLNSNISRIIIEFVLWDLYFYAQLNGAEKKPKMVVLDEMQNLDHSSYSPMAKILTEGRKFGLNLILATQNIANFQKDETSRLFNASQKLFFKPTETEVKSYIKIISDITGDKQTNWAKKLLSLKQGECYAVGSYLKNDGSLFPEAVKIKINNLGSRLK